MEIRFSVESAITARGNYDAHVSDYKGRMLAFSLPFFGGGSQVVLSLFLNIQRTPARGERAKNGQERVWKG